MATSGLVLAAAIAIAAASPLATLEPAFGNTIVTHYPNGKSTRTWLHRDGTYDGQRANGSYTSGIWRIKSGQLCLTQKKPIYVPVAFCTTIVPGHIGTTWPARGLLGEPVRNILVAGGQG